MGMSGTNGFAPIISRSHHIAHAEEEQPLNLSPLANFSIWHGSGRSSEWPAPPPGARCVIRQRASKSLPSQVVAIQVIALDGSRRPQSLVLSLRHVPTMCPPISIVWYCAVQPSTGRRAGVPLVKETFS